MGSSDTTEISEKTAEAAERLRKFEQHHGSEIVGLAAHAALLVVLNPQILHLLRINYFLDPPHVLPYTAEATLLLSSLCSTIDEGLYEIQPELRDLLLSRLIEDFGGARLTDVAGLLWEYCREGAHWSERPGLEEAQQLTALNYIDPAGALNWLARARRGEGAVPVDDDQWFVVMEQDLTERASAVEAARGAAAPATANLPAVTQLHDALTKLSLDRNAAERVALRVDVLITKAAAARRLSGLWRYILDATWVAHRMPDFLAAVDDEVKDNPAWKQAVSEYWSRLSLAFRVDNGSFGSVSPEWSTLEQHRRLLEAAIPAVVLICIERPNGAPKFFGMGALVGDHVVVTHESVVKDCAAPQGAIRSDVRVFVELSTEHTVMQTQELSPPPTRGFEVTGLTVVDPGLAVLSFPRDLDRASMPTPLRLSDDTSAITVGRQVCIIGNPMQDKRIAAQMSDSILGAEKGVTRLQAGEILEEILLNRLFIHNCFTAVGNGGSPVIDLRTGTVVGVHFAAVLLPSSRGLKQGHALCIPRLAHDSALVATGAFKVPEVKRPRPPLESVFDSGGVPFINRAAEQQLFTQMLEGGTPRRLQVIGPGGMGKTALLMRFKEIADERRIRAVLVSSRPGDPREWLNDIGSRLRVTFPAWNPDKRTSRWIFEAVEILRREGVRVLLCDDFNDTSFDFLEFLVRFSEQTGRVVVASPAGAYIEGFYQLSLGPLSSQDIHAWLLEHDIEQADMIARVVMDRSQGKPNLVAGVLRGIDQVLAQVKAAATSPGELGRLTTRRVTRAGETPIYSDDPLEKHGPFVATRGVHTTIVPARFHIATSPVSNVLFAEFIRDDGYRHQEFWQDCPTGANEEFRCLDRTFGPSTWASAKEYLNYPAEAVAGICYYEALAFLFWLERNIAAPADFRWCLPTENMWEFAARGRRGLLYPWGPTFEVGRCNSSEASIGRPSAGGRFPNGRSFYGVEDMAGNVWEFVRATDVETWSCVLRGGSYSNSAAEVKSSLRLFGVARLLRAPDFGIRCALEPIEGLSKAHRGSRVPVDDIR